MALDVAIEVPGPAAGTVDHDDGGPLAPTRWWVRPLAIYLVVAVAVWVVVWLASVHLPRTELYASGAGFDGPALFEGWARWDGLWYRSIARHGYEAYPDVQSSVAFFPLLPSLIAVVAVLGVDEIVAGSVLSVVIGATAAVLLWRWCADRLSPAAATTAVLALCLYPYALYLQGAVYAEGLLLALGLGAFLALERDRTVLAGVLGAGAVLARPTGVAVALGLLVLAVERHVATRRRTGSPRWWPLPVSRRDLPLLLPPAALAAWCTYLWVSFDDPIAFATVQETDGWDQGSGPTTWFKAALFRQWLEEGWQPTTARLVFQALLALGAVALLPRIATRFGLGYAVHTAVLVGMVVVGSKDFQGAGRYLLPAFSLFAVVGEVLADRPVVRAAVLSASAGLLAVFAAAFATGSYVA
ncbi:MAG: hypothetical protein MUF83_07025 [Acidimicrobiales bacterium]|nr:hypothetical protein [Acidimicrobiales bacterium]